MVRKIIHIDEGKCNGCGICARACHEGAIDIVDGKARLTRENFCDGFGDCLPGCPTGAITFEEREAPAYDENAVKLAKTGEEPGKTVVKPAAMPDKVCPGARIRQMNRDSEIDEREETPQLYLRSRLRNWPVEIKLAPIKAPYFDGACLLVAADCTAYAYADFHREFIRGKVTLIGCPKLDAVNYSEKLTEIIRNNHVVSVQVVRMEVPCCGGLEMAVKNAIRFSGKEIPCQVVTIGIDGDILNR